TPHVDDVVDVVLPDVPRELVGGGRRVRADPRLVEENADRPALRERQRLGDELGTVLARSVLEDDTAERSLAVGDHQERVHATAARAAEREVVERRTVLLLR